MWRIESLSVRNFLSFKEMDYKISNGVCTLVFGENKDDESQLSNGSGKSAMTEIIPVCWTGEAMRDVTQSEVIMRGCDSCTLCVVSINPATNMRFEVVRTIYKKASSPSIVTVYLNKIGSEKEQVTEIIGVEDANKFILNTIGLSKEDIFNNFILSKHKYRSFLNASDKEKKEIINKFSNGNVVDNAIVSIDEDLKNLVDQNSKVALELSKLSGSIETLTQQIEEEKENSINRVQSKKEQIASHQKSIEDFKALIKTEEEKIEFVKKTKISSVNSVDDAIQNIEKDYDDTDIPVIHSIVLSELEKIECGRMFSDWTLRANQWHQSISSNKNKLIDIASNIEATKDAKHHAEMSLKECEENAKKNQISILAKIESLGDKKEGMFFKRESKRKLLVELNNELVEDKKEISSLEAFLAGTITCPKCHHEFVVSTSFTSDDPVLEARKKLANFKDELSAIELDIIETEKDIQGLSDEILSIDQQIQGLQESKIAFDATIREASSIVRQISSKLSILEKEQLDLSDQTKSLENKIKDLRVQLFDEAFEIIDNENKKISDIVKNHNSEIEYLKSKIESSEVFIDRLKSGDDDDLISKMSASRDSFIKKHQSFTNQSNELSSQINELTSQKDRFIKFKTYLANTKIEALSKVTNDFLSAIGSDIVVKFSGYTMLKSGKLRDKISISIMRNGVDCGSFGQFSEGEKARVNLATILAMGKLTNANCEDGNGLDFLILDEIMDACDEFGLASIFDAMNKLKQTSIIISHGNIAPNYPHKIVVTKSQGESKIN